ncbi:MAG: hypothetical protein FWH03_07565 [Firmicutes bacterium]|nr:hypothetical protein [Bacillota bacterium]
MDELKVESYDAEKAAAKKRSVSKRVKLGGAIMVALGLFGLTGCDSCEVKEELPAGGAGSWYESTIEEDENTVEENEEETEGLILGGAGAWYESILIESDKDE